MQINTVLKNRFFILTVLMASVVVSRLLQGERDVERLFLFLLISTPFAYWWVVPFVTGEDMRMPTWGFALQRGEHDFLRLLFFVFGGGIYLMCT